MQKKVHFLELDFIKALAIIMIVAFHFFGQLSGWHLHVVKSDWLFDYWQIFSLDKLIRFIEAYFYLGVNLFIIASGFGLYLSYLKAEWVFNFKDFFYKRIVRLLPPAILSIVFLFFLKSLSSGQWLTENWWLNFFPFVAGLNLLSDSWFFPPINGETWFLGLIIQLYLCFPVLIWLHKKVGERWFLLILFLISVLFRTVYYFYWQFSISSLSYGFFVGRLFEFGFGMILAERVFFGKKLSKFWFLGLLIFAGYFFSLIFPLADSLLGIGLFSALWFLASQIKIGSFIKSIAAQSYMMFLIHHPLIWAVNDFGLADAWSFIGVLSFIGVFLVSYYLAKILNRFMVFLMGF